MGSAKNPAWYEDSRTGRKVYAVGRIQAKRMLGLSDRQFINYVNRIGGEIA